MDLRVPTPLTTPQPAQARARPFQLAGGAGLRGLLLTAALLAVAAVLWLWIRAGSPSKAQPHQQTVRVSLLPDLPPPPPPPPSPTRPPEPGKAPARPDTPALNTPNPPPPAPAVAPTQAAPADSQLKSDEPSAAYGALGNGAITSGSPGSGLGGAGTGEGGGSTRMQWGLYTAQLQRELQMRLSRDAALRATDYRVTVKLWLQADGRVQRAELADANGGATPASAIDRQLKSLLTQALEGLDHVNQSPPAGMPQPLLLRITNQKPAA